MVHKEHKVYAGIAMRPFDLWSRKVMCDSKDVGKRKVHYWWKKVTCKSCLKFK